MLDDRRPAPGILSREYCIRNPIRHLSVHHNQSLDSIAARHSRVYSTHLVRQVDNAFDCIRAGRHALLTAGNTIALLDLEEQLALEDCELPCELERVDFE